MYKVKTGRQIKGDTQRPPQKRKGSIAYNIRRCIVWGGNVIIMTAAYTMHTCILDMGGGGGGLNSDTGFGWKGCLASV